MGVKFCYMQTRNGEDWDAAADSQTVSSTTLRRCSVPDHATVRLCSAPDNLLNLQQRWLRIC